MGIIGSKLHQIRRYWGKDLVSIVILGLDGAGKTTVFHKLKIDEEVITTVPTIGFGVETIKLEEHLTCSVWDMGNHVIFRHLLYRNYLQDCHGIIYVVDSNDPERLSQSAEELNSLVTDEILREVPVLLLVNKQDLPNSLSVREVTEKMGMHSLTDRLWHVEGCCAVTGDGLLEGIAELSTLVKKFKKSKLA